MFISRPKKGMDGKLLEFTASNSRNIPLSQMWRGSWCSLIPTFGAVLDKILQLEVRSDDVFLVTFMKSGTTWMQEMAWMLLNDLDYEQGGCLHLTQRSPFLEAQGTRPNSGNEIERCNTLSSPRLIKSHLPAYLLPQQIWEKKTKIIYVGRNCKDVIVSSYHFIKGVGYLSDSNLEDYVNHFIKNEIIYTSYWDHVLNFWKIRNEPNVFFVTYEEMMRDLQGVIERLSEFLDKPRLKDEEMQKLLEHLSFDKMKENPQTNATANIRSKISNVRENFQFMRRGIVGSYRDEMTPALQAKIDKWSAEKLSEHGLTEEDIFGKL